MTRRGVTVKSAQIGSVRAEDCGLRAAPVVSSVFSQSAHRVQTIKPKPKKNNARLWTFLTSK